MPFFLFLSLSLLFSLSFSKPQPDHGKLLAVVKCTTTEDQKGGGSLVIDVYEDWAPLGSRRFVELVHDGYYDHSPLFRVTKGKKFIVQFGISLNKTKERKWENNKIKDDPPVDFPFQRGYMSFAGGGADSRATQIFISYCSPLTACKSLGKLPHETPFGKVIFGMKTADAFYDGWDIGQSPLQGKIKREGRDYLEREYPNLSYIEKCFVASDFSKNSDYYSS
uniref:PPIase cyclophilin-type domain-containing protein n=1 Tax=Paramoeba aestuarina TaxID=180227 RepID=A0A7S4KDR5_9EUKA|mmetsp:Transcript_17538/g.27443  ORF Transcript_17538/g.27443 Transcript_17538/m.27443 type:complete len:222 (+) Transcript_17538:80-745(+)